MSLVAAADLNTQSHWRIVDCRHDLKDAEAGARAYAAGHLPGAIHLHLDRDLSGPTNGRNGRHPLPQAETFASRLGAAGIAPDSAVAAYDDAGGMFAARLWWLLRWIGHKGPVAVLDGGMQAWQAAGLPLTQEVSVFPPQSYVMTKTGTVVLAADVLNYLDTSAAYLLDARSADRFRGENETLDPVGGHIPGAHNRFFRDNLGADGRFKSPQELRAEFETLLDGASPESVVHSCGSGVSACHNLLAMEVAGLKGSQLYAGSWSEWCSDPSRPIEKG